MISQISESPKYVFISLEIIYNLTIDEDPDEISQKAQCELL